MYVLRYDQDRAQMVGPFNDNDEAVRWAQATNVDDDPRWAIVCNCEVTVIEPLAVTRATKVVLVKQEKVKAEFAHPLIEIYMEMVRIGVPKSTVCRLINDHRDGLMDIIVATEDHNKVSEYYCAIDILIRYRNTLVE